VPGKAASPKGLPGDAGTLKFHFYPGKDSAYSDLVGKPGLAAIVVLDRELCHFLNVKFRHRRGSV
jgi:hypothetical protein